MSDNNLYGLNVSENPEQKELIRLCETHWKNMPVVFCQGDAGTGKTIVTAAVALSLLASKTYNNIYYIREPQEVGKSLGFLPGDMKEKYNVYLTGLQQNLAQLARWTKHNPQDYMAKFQCIPPQYCRGATFDDAFIIVDEAQNLRYDTLQMLITRLGKYSKMVVLGSMNQIDIPGMHRNDNDLSTIIRLMRENFPYNVGYVELTKSERSDLCGQFDKVLTDYKTAHPEETHNYKSLEERLLLKRELDK